MDILVNNEVKELCVKDCKGFDWTEDFVAAGYRDEFRWNDEMEMYEISEDDYEWWVNVCKKEQIVSNAMGSEAFEKLSDDEKNSFYSCGGADMESDIESRLAFLRESGVIE